MQNARIIVLGAGMSGMAASKALGDLDCTIYESSSHAGGHASSFVTVNGFIFDEGPHVSFTPHERIKSFLARSVDDRFFEYPTYATNYFQGHVIKHPVQCNLHGLPTELVVRCVADFIRAQYEDKRPVQTYKDWCYRGFGATVSEVFTRPYTRKYWNLELEQLATDWVSERIYAPRLEEVLEGAFSKQDGEHYYMSKFRYPEVGGFGAYNTLLERGAPIEFAMRAVEIDEIANTITFANGKTEHFDHLISTVPLPELVKLCKHAPPAVRQAAGKLVCTSHFLLSVGVNRPYVSDAYWTY
jgi:protoporphyrinogen oxidase